MHPIALNLFPMVSRLIQNIQKKIGLVHLTIKLGRAEKRCQVPLPNVPSPSSALIKCENVLFISPYCR